MGLKFLKSKNEIYQSIEFRVDKKNDDIRLVMFTSKVIVIRMSKKCTFCSIQKKQDPVWVRYLNASERSYLALLQNTMDYGVLSYH